MPASWNQITLVGHVGQDPDTVFQPNGDARTSFSVASSDRPRRDGGEQTTTWFRVTAFRKLAETCQQYLRKGSFVMIVGPVELRTFTKKDGSPGASLEVIANTMRMLDKPGQNGGNDAATAQQMGFAGAPQDTDQVPF